MSLPRKIARSVTANYVGVTGQVIIAFFLSPFLVHTLGDTRYGVWTVVAALSGYLSLLDLGIAAAITRYVAKYYQQKEYIKINRILSSALFLFLAASVFIISISPLVAKGMARLLDLDDSLQETLNALVIIVSFDIAIFVTAGTFRGAFGGLQRFDIINIARLGAMLIKALAFYSFLSSGFGLITMGYISIASNLLIVIFYYWMLRRQYSSIKINRASVNRVHVKRVVHYSKFIFVVMISNQLLNYSSSFVVGYFISVAAVTWYAIPLTLSDYVKQICLAVSVSYIPAFSHLESSGKMEEVYRQYISGTKYILIASNLFCFGMMVLGFHFINLWMGEKYAGYAEFILVMFFVNMYFYSPQMICYALLQGLSLHKNYAYMSIAVSVLCIILSIILVQPYGLEGVAFGTTFPQILFFGIFIPFYVSRIFNKGYVQYLIDTHGRLALPSLVLVLSLYYSRQILPPDSYATLFLDAAIGGSLYLLAVYLISLDRHEKEAVWNLMLRLVGSRKPNR